MTIFLITGPQWVPKEYYDARYRPLIKERLLDSPSCKFVLGAAQGVDTFAQEQLAAAGLGADRVTIYNKGTKDGRLGNFELVNGFDSYPERDVAMAAVADKIILVLPQFGGGQSGSMVPLLSLIPDKNPTAIFATPTAILTYIRQYSEPFDQVLLEKIVQVYREHYERT